MTAETSGSAERAQRANEFAKPKHPGIVGVTILSAEANRRVIALFRCTQMVLQGRSGRAP